VSPEQGYQNRLRLAASSAHKSLDASGATVLRVEGSHLVPAATENLEVGERALKHRALVPADGVAHDLNQYLGLVVGPRAQSSHVDAEPALAGQVGGPGGFRTRSARSSGPPRWRRRSSTTPSAMASSG